MAAEKTLYETHPSMWRNNPLGFLLAVLLCAVGVGILILLYWWLQTLGTTLIITDQRSTLRKGILSKYTNDVRHSSVRNVQISQSFLQRMFGVGKIGISSAGQSGLEIEVAGVPNPEKVKRLIDDNRGD